MESLDSLSFLTVGDGDLQFDHSALLVSPDGPKMRTGLKTRRGRSRRPRSSPERLMSSEAGRDLNCRSIYSGPFESLRYRSPSASPIRRDYNMTGFHQRISLGAGEAYFSARPPAEPTQLVLVGQPPVEGCHLPNQLLRLLKLQNLDNADSISDVDDDIDDVSIEQPEPVFLDFSSMQSYAVLSEFHYAQEKFIRVEMVRHILHKLVSELPLAITSRSSMLTMSSKRQSLPPMSTTPRLPIPRSPMSMQDHSPNRHQKNAGLISRCSIAVQARQHPNSGSTEATRKSFGTDRAENEDWVGGVRALRDSHVRLVLRQLRHIHRLNRALDRVSKVAKPKPVHDQNN